MKLHRVKLINLGIGFGIFLLMFFAYEYFVGQKISFFSGLITQDWTWRHLLYFFEPLILVIPGALIGYRNQSAFWFYGLLFALLVSLTVFLTGKGIFPHLTGANSFFNMSSIFANYFVVALLSVALGEAATRHR